MVAPIVVPAKAGTQGQTLDHQFIVEIPPLRIMTLDQLKLPGASPFLDPLFAQDCTGHGLVKFGKDEPVDAVIPYKASDRIRPMLPNTTSKIDGYADIERTVALAGEDVNARASLRHRMNQWPWVPAFAGTTNTAAYSCQYAIAQSLPWRSACRFNASRR